MSLYLFLCLLISAIYVIIILYCLNQWTKKTSQKIPTDFDARLMYTILIPARNEEDRIGACLKSILDNDFNAEQFEIIVINDHSTDKTAEIVKGFPSVRLLNLEDHISHKQIIAYKKAALNYGIQSAQGDFIICTDADSIVTKNWIKQFAYHHEVLQYQFIAAPVVFEQNEHWISKFEALDIIGMMGLTNAGIESKQWYLANGANLGFDKTIYLNNRPVLQGDDQLASGDDMLLISAFAEWAQKVGFIKNRDAMVMSEANQSISSFFKQRLRWATKNKYSKSILMLFIMAVPYLLCLTIILNATLMAFSLSSVLIILSIQLFLKMGVDYIYLLILSKDLNHPKLTKRFLLSAINHVLYIAMIGTLSFFVKQYSWKERKVK